MADGIVRPITKEVLVDSYADCLTALHNRDLSRTFDLRSYEEGNVRQGNVSTLHGRPHRDRRRLENRLFRSERLELYERELFPQVMDRLLDRLIARGDADLVTFGKALSLVLSAHRAGIDVDSDDLHQLERLVEFVTTFSRGSAIIDAAGSADEVRQLVMEAMAWWERDFFEPSRIRREKLIEQWRAGQLPEDGLPNDVLTIALRHQYDDAFGFNEGSIAREVATYLHGGAHTSAQTLVNTSDMVLSGALGSDGWQRVAADPEFAQRCVHETLRLRPTTPRLKRYAETDTNVGDIEITEGSLVIIDVEAANRDVDVFGDDADAFNPLRAVGEKAFRWGLTFGAGPHQCPGRNVAVGLPLGDEGDLDEARHLFGLVTAMVQAVAAFEPAHDPHAEPRRDESTVRWTRWASYPVVFTGLKDTA